MELANLINVFQLILIIGTILMIVYKDNDDLISEYFVFDMRPKYSKSMLFVYLVNYFATLFLAFVLLIREENIVTSLFKNQVKIKQVDFYEFGLLLLLLIIYCIIGAKILKFEKNNRKKGYLYHPAQFIMTAFSLIIGFLTGTCLTILLKKSQNIMAIFIFIAFTILYVMALGALSMKHKYEHYKNVNVYMYNGRARIKGRILLDSGDLFLIEQNDKRIYLKKEHVYFIELSNANN